MGGRRDRRRVRVQGCCSGSPSLRVVCSPMTGAHSRELSINPYQQRTREHRRAHETTGPDTKYIWVRHRKAKEQSQSMVRPKERLTQQSWQEPSKWRSHALSIKQNAARRHEPGRTGTDRQTGSTRPPAARWVKPNIEEQIKRAPLLEDGEESIRD